MKKFYLTFGIVLITLTQLFGQAEFNTGTFEVVVNSYGRIRFYTAPPTEIRQLQRASILVAVSPEAVFDYTEDTDSFEPTELIEEPEFADFEIYGAYNNGYSEEPPHVVVRLNAYGWENKSFTILKYTIENTEAEDMNAIVGMEIIPELNEEYGNDTVTYNAEHAYLRFHRGTDLNMGLKALSGDFTSLSYFEWYSGYSEDESYWNWMTSGELQSQYASETEDGLVAITGQEAQTIESNGSIDVYFAFALGEDEAEMAAALEEAAAIYDDIISGLSDLNTSDLWLNTNAPNPAQGNTTISYSLPSNGNVSLTIYDQLGNIVAIPVQENQTAGLHTVSFNSNQLAAGMYFYTLNFNGKSITKKMLVTD